MQFVTNGPDIPDALLQAHEDGRVVFFCGAGISYPARLPGFAGLVAKVYEALTVTPNAVQQAAIKAGQFDTAVGLLEADIVGGRGAVRRALAGILTPDLRAPNAIATHAALLTLSKCRNGHTRLITTNFDRLFEEAIAAKSLPIERFQAPLLPVPKNRWDGLVYLHGLLGAAPTASNLDRLVVSSGDFGLAYLTERWAARFVSELFRNYTVCFVGYSINDPVMRYMMDALAADRLLGESPPEMFAFGSFSKGKDAERGNEWRAKNVTPILYREHNRHAYLHKTLRAWADTYRDGVTGKERIVVAHALARPSASSRQDDFVGRMLWALSDPSGLPARRFAEFNPVPSLDWLLDAFAADRYVHNDLVRFGVPPRDKVDPKLRFSLIQRPAPYALAPPMRLVAGGVAATQWDDVMFQIARWLLRHLNDPRLILWIVERGGQLHEQWIWQIEHRLGDLAQLERDGKSSDLDDIRANAPKAIPGPVMRALWRLILSGRVKSPWAEPDLYRWKSRLKRDGMNPTLRLELRDLLSPRVRVQKPFRWGDDADVSEEPTRVSQVANCELVLVADHIRTALRDGADAQWYSALPTLIEDLQQLLRDALDLLRELGQADEHRDRSHWDLPSISPHWQNRGFREWVILIELLRDSWLAVREVDQARSSLIASAWFDLPYPTFKRLALFAASKEACISPDRWVDWLLADGAWWLWTVETRREVMRLLVLSGRSLTGESQDRLESAIAAGPPRAMYADDLEPDHWQQLVNHSVWLRLAKLSSSGLILSPQFAARLEALSRAHPDWQLAANESDEFSHWMSGTGDPDFLDRRQPDIAPRNRRDLVGWLAKPPPDQGRDFEDTWTDVCRSRFFHSLYALRELADQEIWPLTRWREALQVWSEEAMVRRSWRFAAPIVEKMPAAVMQELVQAVARWLQVASKAIDRHESIFLRMCWRVVDLPLDADAGIRRGNGEPIEQPVTEAINHPIGHVTEALINLWLQREPNDGDGLPEVISAVFTRLSDVRVRRFRHGRVILSSRLIALFRVDQSWTERNLLPLLDWTDDPIEARSAWEGFLWSPRLYRPLLLAFRRQFLDTSKHYGELGEHAQQFSAFLTYAALWLFEVYTIDEWRAAIGALPKEGLEESAQALAQALEGAGDQREEYFRNRIQPFWQQVWPKARDLATPRIAASLARLSIAAGASFPEALRAVQDWLQPVDHPHYEVHLLYESGLSGRFPVESLRLLGAIITDQMWIPDELQKCLDQIVRVAPDLAQDVAYRRLQEITRRRAN